jgi:hypothetical protein
MDTSQRCRTCKWWRDDADAVSRYSNVKRCHSPKLFMDGYGSDGKLTVLDDPEHILCDDEAAVNDASGYFASLTPGPDFGCVHWEGKE